jgi:putative ABC transport system permease protein
VSAPTTTARLVVDHLRAGLGASVLVAVLMMITVFVAALVPRAFAAIATDELHYQLGAAPEEQLNLRGDGRIGFPAVDLSDATALDLLGPTDKSISLMPSTLPRPLRDGVGAPSWLIRSVGAAGSNPDNPYVDLSLRLAIDMRWLERITFVSGEAPQAMPYRDPEDDTPPDPIEIALSVRTAEAMGAEAGSILETGIGQALVTGIYEPSDADAAYWRHAFDLGAPLEIRQSGQRPKIQASAYVHPDTLVALQEPFISGILSAWAPVDPMAYSYADLGVLRTQAGNLTVTPRSLPDFGQVSFGTAMPELLDRTRETVTATSALIALAASGLVGVLIATYALSIQALVRRRRSALSLLSARGTSPRQLRALMVIEASLIALPGSALAIAGATLLVPQRIGLDGWLAPVGLAIIPIALAAILVAPGSLRESRQDVAVRSSSSLRWVLEASVAGAAVLALVLLQRRGLVASSDIAGIDPLLSATPLLIAATVGLLALRLYPLPLRLVRAMARTRTAPVWEVGSARAVREPAIGAIASLALVIGVTIVVFTTVMISTVGATMETAARERLGADAEVTAHDLPEQLVTEIQRLPGVDGAVALTTRGGLTLTDQVGGINLTVVLADPTALAAVRPDLPPLTGAPSGTLPILVSAELADRIQGSEVTLEDRRATVVGVIGDVALPGPTGLWLIAQQDAATALGLDGQVPSRILVALADDRDAATIAAITELVFAAQPPQFADGARIADVQSELRRGREAPITFGLEASLVIVAGASLILTMLVVALASAASTLARNRIVGVLRILGMTPRQVRSLVAWEFGPVAVASIVVGSAVGLGLPYLVTAVLDLRAFFGGTSLPQPVLDPAWIAIAVGSYTLAIAAAVLVASALGRRFAPASTLKMGEA